MKYIFKFREASVEPYDERYPETLLPLVAAEYTRPQLDALQSELHCN